MALEEKLRVTNETFVIPSAKGEYIVYAPLQGALMKVTSRVIDLLKKVNRGENPWSIDPATTYQLIDSKILVPGSKDLKCDTRHLENRDSYSPTSVTILPTYNCNLRCVYCYANAGELLTPPMPSEIATSAIDLIVKNALKKGERGVSLSFHGGGEPFLEANKDLIIQTVDYFRKISKLNNLRSHIGAVTNGVIPRDYLGWIIKNFNNLSISIDGPEDIQNSQRPRYSKDRDSFRAVVNTIEELEKQKFRYGVRATITLESAKRMPEIIEFFLKLCPSVQHHQLEPLCECGRCETTNQIAPNPEVFLENFLKAKKIIAQAGKTLAYSGGSLEKLSDHFCGACGSNFFVTPLGDVTTCLEVCRREDSRSDKFYIGSYNPKKKKFEFKQDKIEILLNRRIGKMPDCCDCFAKFNCAGDCPAKSIAQTGDLFSSRDSFRCSINQGVLLEELKQRLDLKTKV